MGEGRTAKSGNSMGFYFFSRNAVMITIIQDNLYEDS